MLIQDSTYVIQIILEDYGIQQKRIYANTKQTPCPIGVPCLAMYIAPTKMNITLSENEAYVVVVSDDNLIDHKSSGLFTCKNK